MSNLWPLAVVAVISSAQPPFSPVLETLIHGKNDLPLHWSLQIGPVLLSENQRLATSISVRLDADDVVKWARPLGFFIDMRDETNCHYRSGVVTVVLGTSRQFVNVSQGLFAKPGKYDVIAVVFDPKTNQHNIKQTSWRVPIPSTDFLRDIWRDTPAVEFFPPSEPPPRRWLPLENDRPVHIDLIVNQAINGP